MISVATALKAGPYAALALALAWGAYERNGWQNAERRLLEQQNTYLKAANEAWNKVNTIRLEFDEDVAAGLAKINAKQRQLDGTIDDYRKAVASDPTGRTALTDRERQRLRLLVGQPPASLDPAASNVRTSNAPAPVRN